MIQNDLKWDMNASNLIKKANMRMEEDLERIQRSAVKIINIYHMRNH